ncbi:MAG: RsmB/NOP family class I SAM-dependent RNA methyltransferase, partial [Pseudomonadota bacterium]
ASYKAGQVEIQAEASQVAALLANAKPGMRIVDFCAGAGGKTLALAASMNNRGRLIACDTDKGRLEAASRRLRRAGVANAETRVLSGARDKWVKRHKNSFDVVFVDAPCSGSGTWRRNPDAKWRFTKQDLEELAALQAEILDSACRLVRPGGRLVYATCSLLHRENEEQVAKFQSAHDDFSTVPIRQAWLSLFRENAPDLELAEEVETLTLTTARHGTDGFFVAVMERAKEPEAAASDIADAAH